jgi:hypothetical protein
VHTRLCVCVWKKRKKNKKNKKKKKKKKKAPWQPQSSFRGKKEEERETKIGKSMKATNLCSPQGKLYSLPQEISLAIYCKEEVGYM